LLKVRSDTPALSAMSSLVMFSKPRSNASSSAASLSALRVSSFLRSRSPSSMAPVMAASVREFCISGKIA